MKFKKIIHLFDNHTWYKSEVYSSKQSVEIDMTLGDPKILFDQSRFSKVDQTDIKRSFFPAHRVTPLYLNYLDDSSVIIISPRSSHYLFNATISSNEVSKELMYNSTYDRLLYLFFGFKGSNFTIRPRITKDIYGLIDRFKNNLTDNLLRQTILDFLLFPDPPKESIETLMFKRADNSISWEGKFFRIKFLGKHELFLEDTESLRDIIYIIKNKIDSSKILDLFKKIRGKKVEDLNTKREKINQKNLDDVSALDSLIKNRDRLLNRIKIDEDNKKIIEQERFSTFIKNYIEMTTRTNSISYKAPKEIKWEFMNLPPEINTFFF